MQGDLSILLRNWRRGLKCTSCQHFMEPLHRAVLVCKNCGCKEDVELAVLRSVKDFRVMFPEMKITTNIVNDWCSYIISKKKIRKILSNNFGHIIHDKTSYFE
jgi:hypothetical protein